MEKSIFVYITNPSKKEAERIALHLLQKRLIGCANIIGPTVSLYKWKGKVTKEREFILVGKTLEGYFKKIKNEVEKIHSYSIPCISKIVVDFNERYWKWLKNEIIKRAPVAQRGRAGAS